VAAQGRYLDGREDPRTRSVGPKTRGVFAAVGAWEAAPLILCEAPIDALSLAACGHPALALLGRELPDWLAWACALRPVQVALDADDAGDLAAQSQMRTLVSRGATVARLRPAGGKDWNEVLQASGVEALRSLLHSALAPSSDVTTRPDRPRASQELVARDATGTAPLTCASPVEDAPRACAYCGHDGNLRDRGRGQWFCVDMGACARRKMGLLPS
jgi:hypothetical protein